VKKRASIENIYSSERAGPPKVLTTAVLDAATKATKPAQPAKAAGKAKPAKPEVLRKVTYRLPPDVLEMLDREKGQRLLDGKRDRADLSSIVADAVRSFVKKR